jgi:hypothetical protein
MNGQLERMWKKTVMAKLRYYPNIRLEDTIDIHLESLTFDMKHRYMRCIQCALFSSRSTAYLCYTKTKAKRKCCIIIN